MVPAPAPCISIDTAKMEAMARKSLAAARPYAARDLVNELEALIAG